MLEKWVMVDESEWKSWKAADFLRYVAVEKTVRQNSNTSFGVAETVPCFRHENPRFFIF